MSLGLILLTYILLPLVVSAAAIRFLKVEPDKRLAIIIVGFAVTPALISRFLIWELRFIPEQQSTFYIALTLLPFVGLGLYGYSRNLLSAFPFGFSEYRFSKRQIVNLAVTTMLLLTVSTAMFSGSAQSSAARWFAELYGAKDAVEKSFGRWGLVTISILIAVLAVGSFLRYRQNISKLGSSDERPDPIGDLVSRPLAWFFPRILGAILVGLLLVIATVNLGGYLRETDSLQHMKTALLIFQERSVAHYPFVPAVADGTYATSSHPLGHHGVFVWNYLIQGAALPDLNKIPVLVSFLATIGMIVFGFPAFSVSARLAVAILMAATPAYIDQTVNAGIDAPRLFLLFAATWFLVQATLNHSWRWFVVAGIVMGLSINSHAINLLFGFFVSLALALSYRNKPLLWLAHLALFGIIAVVVGADQYIANIIKWGQPTYASQPLWELAPQLDYASWRAQGVNVASGLQRAIHVGLVGFNSWYFFGLTYWICVVSALFCWPELKRDPVAWRMGASGVFAVFSFSAFAFFSSSAGEFVNNYRYQMTALPLMVLLAAGVFSRFLPSGISTRTVPDGAKT